MPTFAPLPHTYPSPLTHAALPHRTATRLPGGGLPAGCTGYGLYAVEFPTRWDDGPPPDPSRVHHPLAGLPTSRCAPLYPDAYPTTPHAIYPPPPLRLPVLTLTRPHPTPLPLGHYAFDMHACCHRFPYPGLHILRFPVGYSPHPVHTYPITQVDWTPAWLPCISALPPPLVALVGTFPSRLVDLLHSPAAARSRHSMVAPQLLLTFQNYPLRPFPIVGDFTQTCPTLPDYPITIIGADVGDRQPHNIA